MPIAPTPFSPNAPAVAEEEDGEFGAIVHTPFDGGQTPFEARAVSHPRAGIDGFAARTGTTGFEARVNNVGQV
jgi:hypothetical protein